VTVTTGQLIVIHLNPAAPTTELASQTGCVDSACYAGAWDFDGGLTGLTYSRSVVGIADPYNAIQDAAAFTNGTTSPVGYPTALQSVQASGDWLPVDCGGALCDDTTSTPSANDVSADWTGCEATPTGASVQRISTVDTDSNDDWLVGTGSIGAANTCPANTRVVNNSCVACPAGQSNLAGDDPAGGNTTCDPFAVLRISEIAPNQNSGRDLVELTVMTGGTVRDLTLQLSGVTLATLPDVTVTAGQLIVIHLNPDVTVTSELASIAGCSDAACYAGAWDFNGGTTGIAYSRHVLAIVDPYLDHQDVAALSDQGSSPAAYPTVLQSFQASGDWLPLDCAGAPCTDASTPTANSVSIDWTGCGTGPTGASVQRTSVSDTNAKADWAVATGTFGVANP
jgi:hypothetical protein